MKWISQILSIHIGIILLDPPFIPRHESGPPFEVKSPEDLQSLCEQYYDSLHKMPSDFLAGAALQPFLIIRSLYQIIASDWVVMGSYINRELQAIEFNLEIAQHDVAQCEEYLVHLAAYRRRISCYLDLVRQQLASIEAFGCKAWAVGRLRNEMEQARNELREDFKHVLGLLENHSQRINHNLELLLGLRGVYESRESRILSRIMASLALVGILFLPFNTVATILGMQGDFGPGSKRFWVYWAISIPVMTVLVLVHIAYSIPREPSVRRT
jgi:Mg2+ and Co2+ transporter CorA